MRERMRERSGRGKVIDEVSFCYVLCKDRRND